MKRLLCILWTAVLCTALCLPVFGAADAIGEADLAFLAQHGIMQGDPDGNLRLEAGITRAEAAKLILTALGSQPLAPAATAFSDVPASHWASGYIQAAYTQGLIDGAGEGRFAPEAQITNEEFVKLLVCALGYKPFVLDNGGDNPLTYMKAVDRYQLLPGVDFTAQALTTRGMAAAMVTAALDVPVMRPMEEGQYAIMDGLAQGIPRITLRTLLEQAQ